MLLFGDGKGNFIPQPAFQSGLNFGGDVKGLALLKNRTQKLVLAANNNDALKIVSWQSLKENNK